MAWLFRGSGASYGEYVTCSTSNPRVSLLVEIIEIMCELHKKKKGRLVATVGILCHAPHTRSTRHGSIYMKCPGKSIDQVLSWVGEKSGFRVMCLCVCVCVIVRILMYVNIMFELGLYVCVCVYVGIYMCVQCHVVTNPRVTHILGKNSTIDPHLHSTGFILRMQKYYKIQTW